MARKEVQVSSTVGDWWKIAKTNSKQLRSLEVAPFLAKAEDAVRSKMTGWSIQRQDCRKQAMQWHPASLRCVVDEKVFARICDTAGKLASDYAPVLAFHGTSSPDSVNGIVKHGYLMPGELNPETGETLSMANGQLHGLGIYTTQDFETVFDYCCVDDRFSLYVIVNLVVLGRVELVYTDLYSDGLIVPMDDVFYCENTERHTIRDDEYQQQEEKKKRRRLKKNEEADLNDTSYRFVAPKSKAAATPGDFVHTRVFPNVHKMLSASSRYVVPLFVAEYKGAYDFGKMALYAGLSSSPSSQQQKLLTIYKAGDEPLSEDEKKKMPVMTMHRVVDDLYSCNLQEQHARLDVQQQTQNSLSAATTLQLNQEHHRHHLLLPVTLKTNQRFHGYMKAFVNTLPGCWLYAYQQSSTFGSDRRISDCGAGEAYMNAVRSWPSSSNDSSNKKTSSSKSEKPDDAAAGLAAALHSCLDRATKDDDSVAVDEKSKSSSKQADGPARVDVIYLCLHGIVDAVLLHSPSLARVLEKWSAYVRVRRIVLKVIGVDCTAASLEAALKLKRCLSSGEELWEELYHAIEDDDHDDQEKEESDETDNKVQNDYTTVFDRLAAENRRLSQAHSLQVDLPVHLTGQGFVEDLTQLPLWSCRPSTTAGGVLYVGRQAPVLQVGHTAYRVEYSNELDATTAANLVTSLVSRLRNAIVAQPMLLHRYRPIVEKLCAPILGRIDTCLALLTTKTRQQQDGDGKSSAPAAVVKTLLQVNQELSTLRRFAARLTSVLAELSSLAAVQFSGKWYQALNGMKFKRAIVRRFLKAKNQHKVSDRDVAALQQGLDLDADCMLAALAVQTTSASEIEPWLIKVDRVVPTASALQSVLNPTYLYYASEFGRVVTDSTGHVITDVLLPPIVSSSSLRAYYAYVFTRNPYLYLPSQVTALHTLAWVRMVEDLLLSPASSAADMIKAIKCVLEAGRRVAAFKYWTATNRPKQLEQIMAAATSGQAEFQVYLTEAHDVPSVAVLLGALCACPEQARALFSSSSPSSSSSSFYSQFAFALLAEAVMRSCRAHMRSSGGKDDALHHLRRVLGLKDKLDDQKDWKLDVDRSCGRCSKVLLPHGYSNTSAWAVVGVLELLERLHLAEASSSSCNNNKDHDDDVAQQLAKAFGDKDKVSMKQFLLRHLPPKKMDNSNRQPPILLTTTTTTTAAATTTAKKTTAPSSLDMGAGDEKKRFAPDQMATDVSSASWGKRVQLALVLQGLRYNSAQQRASAHVQFSDPDRIILEIAREQVENLARQAQVRARLSGKRQARQQLLLERGSQYLIYHHLTPRLFDFASVALENAKRPANDQLELMPSGLLKHHCCYPDCPMYLKNLATEDDRKLRRLRRGLFNHLQYDQSVLNNYVPEFHLFAKTLLGKNSSSSNSDRMDFETFVAKMDAHFSQTYSLSNWYNNNRDRMEKLRRVWLDYQGK